MHTLDWRAPSSLLNLVRVFVAAAAVSVAGCGGDGGTPEKDAGGTNGGSSNGASGQDGGSTGQQDAGDTEGGRDGGSSSSNGSDGDGGGTLDGGEGLEVEDACATTQERCRGACFDNVGQTKNGCELVWKSPGDLTIAGHVSVPGALLGFDFDGLKRISTSDFSVILLDDLGFAPAHSLEGDVVYYGGSPIRRVSVNGGAASQLAKLTSPMRADHGKVHGDYFYFYHAGNHGLFRVLAAGGKEELVIDELMYGAAFDDQDIYTCGSFPNPEIRRRAWDSPGTYETVLNEPRLVNSPVLQFASDPTKLYWHERRDGQLVRSIARSGGVPETVYSFGAQAKTAADLQQTTDSIVYRHASGDPDAPEPEGIELCNPNGSKCSVLDIGDERGTVAEDASYVYLARYSALFRIAKSGL